MLHSLGTICEKIRMAFYIEFDKIYKIHHLSLVILGTRSGRVHCCLMDLYRHFMFLFHSPVCHSWMFPTPVLLSTVPPLVIDVTVCSLLVPTLLCIPTCFHHVPFSHASPLHWTFSFIYGLICCGYWLHSFWYKDYSWLHLVYLELLIQNLLACIAWYAIYTSHLFPCPQQTGSPNWHPKVWQGLMILNPPSSMTILMDPFSAVSTSFLICQPV